MPNLTRIINRALGRTEATPEERDAQLRDATERGHTHRMRSLLGRGANADGLTAREGSPNRGSPVHIAARNANSNALRALFEYGANPVAPDPGDDGRTPMHMLAGAGVDLLRNSASERSVRRVLWAMTEVNNEASSRRMGIAVRDDSGLVPSDTTAGHLRDAQPSPEASSLANFFHNQVAGMERRSRPVGRAPNDRQIANRRYESLNTCSADEAGFTADTECIITANRMSGDPDAKPVALKCGSAMHVCEFTVLWDWALSHGTNPITREALEPRDFAQHVFRIIATPTAPARGDLVEP